MQSELLKGREYGWHAPNSLKDSNASSKMKTMEEKKVGVWSLIHNTLG
jgi:hypothetical protein